MTITHRSSRPVRITSNVFVLTLTGDPRGVGTRPPVPGPDLIRPQSPHYQGSTPQDIAVRLPAGCQERGKIDEDRPFAEVPPRAGRRRGRLGRAGGVQQPGRRAESVRAAAAAVATPAAATSPSRWSPTSRRVTRSGTRSGPAREDAAKAHGITLQYSNNQNGPEQATLVQNAIDSKVVGHRGHPVQRRRGDPGDPEGRRGGHPGGGVQPGPHRLQEGRREDVLRVGRDAGRARPSARSSPRTTRAARRCA